MDQEEVCRICRFEGQTLFHPCKCSGSIRYVHQECLMVWLAHSRRSNCELCGHPYSFSPVYRTDMPDTIPARLIVLQLGKKLLNLLCMALRGCLVACMWLFVLPYFTLTIWRFYFWTGQLFGDQLRRLQDYSALYSVSSSTAATTGSDTSVSGIVNHTLEIAIHNSQTLFNQTAINATVNTYYTVLGQRLQISDLKALLADCVQGQIITLIIVAVFISIFHLREWIAQNIPEELVINVGHDPVVIEIDDDPIVIDDDPIVINDDPIVIDDSDDDNDRHNDMLQLERLLHNIRPPLEQQGEQNGNLHNNIQQAQPLVFDNTHTDSNDGGLQHPNFQYQNSTAEIIHSDTRRWDQRAASEPPYTTLAQHYFDDDEAMMLNSSRRYRAASAEPVMSPHNSSRYLPASSSTSSRPHTHQTGTNPFTDIPTASSSSNSDAPHEHGDNDQEQIHILEHRRRYRPRLEAQVPPVVQPGRHEAPPPPPPPPVQQQQQQQQQQREPPPPPPQIQRLPLQDFGANDNNAADDVLDILDAIGMQGSLWTLVQNTVIIGMVISSSIAVTVWLPYLIGMTFVMADLLEVVWVPLLLTRMLTDPLIDWLVAAFMDTTWPLTATNLAALTSTTFNYYISTAPTLFQDLLTPLATKLPQLFFTTMGKNGTTIETSSINMQQMSGGTSLLNLDYIIDILSQWWTQQAEPTVMHAVAWYQHLAVGASMMDRTICIVIGYILALAMSSCNVTKALAKFMFGDRAQGTLRQQYLILKVGLFLAIELFVFPCLCGLLLDFSTLPLQDGISFLASQRLDYIYPNTASSLIAYWFVGSGFMLMFAWIVTSCRAILRPGVLWFISDHNDAQFHPIKEIVQRPVWNHMEKLAISAVMYAIIIVIGVGGSVQSMVYFGSNCLPLQWNLARPITVIPFDLMVVQLVVPIIVHYFPPMQTIKRMYVRWMRYLCRQLRLTSFMFEIRTIDEEVTIRYHTLAAWFKGNILQQQGEADDNSLVWDGQLVRAPRRDGVKRIPGRRMLVPVDRTTLLPLDERDQQLGHPAASPERLGGEETNTTIVYMPRRFKQRVTCFVVMLWIFGCLLISSITIIPLALGRCIVKDGLKIEEPMPDMYSYLTGGVLILMISALVDHSATVIRDVASHSNTYDKIHILGRHVADMTQWVGKCIFFNASFILGMPLLIGMVVEMHFIFPWQDYGDKLPVFAFDSIWLRGFGLMNVIHGVLLLLPTNNIHANLTRVFRNGITNMDLRFFCITVLAPTYVTCTYLLLMPFGFGLLINSFLVNDNIALEIKNMQLSYPVCLGGLLIFYIACLGVYIGDRWVQSIREDHFLVGRTLHNMNE